MRSGKSNYKMEKLLKSKKNKMAIISEQKSSKTRKQLKANGWLSTKPNDYSPKKYTTIMSSDDYLMYKENVPVKQEPEPEEITPKPEETKKIPEKPIKTSTEECIGWNKMGCKSESIKKVQTCLNLPASSIFDGTLKTELAKYASTFAYKDGFNDSDVEKICRLKNVEDKNRILQQQKQAELERFRRQYPQQTTKATTIDEL